MKVRIAHRSEFRAVLDYMLCKPKFEPTLHGSAQRILGSPTTLETYEEIAILDLPSDVRYPERDRDGDKQ